MTAAAWIALVGLAFAILGQFAAWVYSYATQAQRARDMASRLDKLETAPKDDCAAQLLAMTATLGQMEKRLDRMDAAMDSRFSGLESRLDAAIKHNAPAARRRAA